MITIRGDKLKDKIEHFSRGEFEYELPFICLSVEEIRITVEEGKTFEGSIKISNSQGRSMKGVLYTFSRLLTFENATFDGKENQAIYRFQTLGLKAGDSVTGEISIVSDCGEYTLPFSAQVEAPSCNTSIGKIRDLFHFANLARMDWTEAKKVFRSEDFERIILRNEDKYHVIYRSLIKNVSTSQALEEFLITVHKKSRINLKIDKTSLEYDVTEEFMDKLVLTKDHWGYAEIRVSTDAPFIRLEQKFVWADRFIGNTHQISFAIDPKAMRQGNNFGRIWIKTVHQTLAVDIVCRYHSGEGGKDPAYRNTEMNRFDFIRRYLDFRMDRINLVQYLKDTDNLVHRLPDTNDIEKKLMKIHLAILSEKNRLAAELLNEFSGGEAVLRKQSTLYYSAYLYLLALYRKDEDIIRFSADTIRRYYVSGHFDWRILWFLLYTDKRYDKNRSQKLADIREQFIAGCHSPILYYEAVCVFNEEPYLLRDLSDFELQVLNFGIKNRIINKDTALQFTYLANRRKNFHPVIFRCLGMLYREFEDTEILSAICCMLIKGYKKDSGYFIWFRLGVEAQLRITELYEYYMYTVDETMKEPLPQPLLLYFIYNSSLNDKKRAFLYANIIKNKAGIESIYHTYYKRMEVFALKQLEAHNVSPSLVVLYREFFGKNTLNNEIYEHLPYVMFTYELHCDNRNMVGVQVIHKELEEEENQPINEGIARIQLYTSNANVFLTDAFGNRYTVSVEYTINPMFSQEEFGGLSLDQVNHPMLKLHLFEHYERNRVVNENTIALRKQVLTVPGLKDEYYIECLLTLIEYYYENYDAELLEQYLLRLDLNRVKEAKRIKFLEYMVVRGYYDKALDALKTFGFEGISINRLVRLCSGWIINSGLNKKQDLFIALCFYIFTQGKYDEAIIQYLVKYYHGPTTKMFDLWQAARGFEVEAHELEERLLVQMLFAESYTKDSFRIFAEYYKNVSNPTLVRAFLSYYAYKYLVHDRVIGSDLFPIMRRELNYEENDICLLAWMKFNVTNRELSEHERSFISFHMERLMKRGIILPFFSLYRNTLTLPERIRDKCYIEYKTDPKKQVFLHYRLLKTETDSEYITERMPDIFHGIHVREFILFYHEDLQYYITEEAEEEVSITESFHIRYDGEASRGDESKYNQINLMLAALGMQDEATLLELMENYVRSDYLVDRCFQPLP